MASHAQLSSYISSLAPVAYWKLDESSGTAFAQSGSSTAASMTAVGTVLPGDVALIPGDTTGFVTLPPGTYTTASRGNVVVPVTNITVSCIIKYPGPALTQIRILQLIAAGDTVATNSQILLFIDSADQNFQDFVEYSAGTNQDIISEKRLDPRYAIGDGVLVFTTTRNAATNTQKFYLNGVLFDTVSYANDPTGGTSTFFVIGNHTGSLINTPTQQNVSFGHMCFFDRVLSDSEVYGIADNAGLADPLGELRFAADAVNVPDLTILRNNVSKTLLCAIDPLVDISVAFPDDAYTTED